MKNINHPSETLPIDISCQTGLPLFSGGVFIMKEIKLSQGQVALVDNDDYQHLCQYKWYAMKNRRTFYAVRKIRVDGKRNTQYMHGAIMNRKLVDHIDGNGLNNQRSNLRLCTQSENLMNQRIQENRSSVYKGVSFSKHNSKWRTGIKINGKQIDLGFYVLEIDAAKAYNVKAKELFGEFARLNNID